MDRGAIPDSLKSSWVCHHLASSTAPSALGFLFCSYMLQHSAYDTIWVLVIQASVWGVCQTFQKRP
jgi:hypothetical protein